MTAQKNEEACCGNCPFFEPLGKDEWDVDPNTGTRRRLSEAWGHCNRFPKPERKTPASTPCGEHPEYWEVDRMSWLEERIANAKPGEVIPIKSEGNKINVIQIQDPDGNPIDIENPDDYMTREK